MIAVKMRKFAIFIMQILSFKYSMHLIALFLTKLHSTKNSAIQTDSKQLFKRI